MQKHHPPHILNRTPRNTLQFQLSIRLPPLLPRIQPFVRLDTQRIVPLSDDLVDFTRTEAFLLDCGWGYGGGGGGIAGCGIAAAWVVGFVFILLFWEEEEGVKVGGDVDEDVY